MAKKSEFDGLPTKSINEMSDIEFITSADYLASPYYRAYVNARARTESGDTINMSKSTSSAKAKKKKGKTIYTGGTIKGAVYSKKRGLAHILIAVFMLIVLAVALLSYFNIGDIDSFISIYVKKGVNKENNEYIGLIDPIFGLVKKLAKSNVDSFYFDSYLSNISPNTGIMTKISLYAVPVAALLIVLCALIGLVKSIGALLSKRQQNGMYKKYKFGFLSIVMLLSSLIVLVGGMFASGTEIGSILDFLLMKIDALSAGYGLYAIIAIPIITLILSCISYKKA